MSDHPLDYPLFIAAALRGLRLQHGEDGLYSLYQREGDQIVLVAAALTFKDVANRCGATGAVTLRQAVERDGLEWPATYAAFLALARTV